MSPQNLKKRLFAVIIPYITFFCNLEKWLKYSEFRSKVKNYPLFHGHLFPHLTHDVPTLRRQVTEWIQKGYVLPLKRGIYTLCDEDRSANFSRLYLANQLYMPSYISLETALSYYNIIPEGVYAITSISSKKTQQFNNAFGQFIYHHFNPKLFGDFVMIQDEFNNPVYIASKERAIIDFLYLKIRWQREYDPDIFRLSYRFQNLQDLDIEKLKEISEKFKIKKMEQLLEILIKNIGEKYD